MGIPGPAGLGSCFRFSDTINLRAADAILSRARRNNVVVHQLLNLVLKLNVGVEGARRIAVEAQMQAQRIGNATDSRIHISILYIYIYIYPRIELPHGEKLVQGS